MSKITIVNQFFPPDFAATGQFVYELACELSHLNYDVQIYTGLPGYAFNQSDAPRYEVKNGVRIFRTRASQVLSKRIRWKLMNAVLFWLRCFITLRHPEVRGNHLLLTSATPFLFIVGWFYNLFCHQTYSCLVYDIYPDVAIRLGVVKADHWIVKIWSSLNTLAWHRCHSIIVLNQSMKQLLTLQNPELANKIYVIPTWANSKLIHPIPKSENWFAHQHHLDPYFIVLYSGNLGRCHDEETLIRAAQLLQKEEKIRFVFIGDGVGHVRIRQEIQAGNLTNVIQFPYQEAETLAYSLSTADIALISLKPGFGSVVAPSKLQGILASGRPLLAVCAPQCYLRDLIKEGQYGYAVDNGDAQTLAALIQDLAVDHHKRLQLGQNARTYFENCFTLERVVPSYIQALDLSEKAKI